MKIPRCSRHPESPAACLGTSEGDDLWDFFCNECCGHGDEDGKCVSVHDLPTAIAAMNDTTEIFKNDLKESERLLKNYRGATP